MNAPLARLLGCLASGALLLVLAAGSALAVLPPDAPRMPALDVRGERAGVRAPKTPVQARAFDALAKELASSPGGELVLVTGPDPGSVHLLFRRDGWLSGRSVMAPPDFANLALAFVTRHRDLLGLGASSDAVRSLAIRRVIADPGTGARHVAIQQVIEGIPIFHGRLGVHLDHQGRIVSISGDSSPFATAPAAAWMTPQRALAHAAQSVGMSLDASAVHVVAKLDPPEPGADAIVVFAQGAFGERPWASRAWFPLASGLRPAWIATLDVSNRPGGSWFQVAIDAETGVLLHRVDLVAHVETEGLVFRENPDEGPQELLPFVDGEALTHVASPLGWAEAAETRGNNCDVKDDLAADNENTEGRRAIASAGPPLSFAFPFNDDPALDLDASMTNLFWLNNWLHDRLARMGFDEASGNFQAANVSGQGLGGDAVRVDAQDGSGRNNANFATPPDGFPPRMQMFIWTLTSPSRDSGFDSSVVTHELMHGVSNRLVGLAANHAGCLGGPQGGAMGEAWSDFFACSFWDTPVVGAYVSGNAIRGIRRSPYDTHPYDYGELCNQGGFQVHRDGEIWAATLWHLRDLFMARHGAQRGRCLIERLVLDGMKLAPCSPTFVDMRDAILLAARLRGDDGDTCLLWQGFAAHGLGTLAVSRTDCTSAADASFEVPVECADCNTLAAPTNVVLDVSLPNRVVARFVPSPGADAHVLLRSRGACPGACAEAPFEEVARGAGDAVMLEVGDLPDEPMSSGDRFAFRVVALRGACSAGTDCAEVTVTGRCTLRPVSASDAPPGLRSISRVPQAECSLALAWTEARAACGSAGALTYNVYRSDMPLFVPGPELLVATVPAPATSWIDASPPPGQATYVVRAEDLTTGGEGPHGGNEEANLAWLSAEPVGAVTGTTSFADDAESGERPGYRRTGSLPVNDWAITSDANTRGGSAWHADGVEGGNADKNLHLPLLSFGAAPRLRFQHAFQFEDEFDGAVIEISVDGGESWRDLIDEIVVGGYDTSLGGGFSRTVGDLIHPPNTDELWTGENASGFPTYDPVEVDLSAHAGLADVQLRFRMLVDPLAVEPGGWYVDDIVVDDVLAFDSCASACTDPPTALLADVRACVSPTESTRVILDASASTAGGMPLRGNLSMVLTHDGPGSFQGRRWAEGPVAEIEFPLGTTPGAHPVALTVRDERGCAASVTASVLLQAESVVPPPVGDSLRVVKSAGGLRLDWAGSASEYNVHVAPFGTDLAPGLHVLAPWSSVSSPSADLLSGSALEGGGSIFLSVYSATDCGRSIP